jgi:hypothetical protein
MAARIQEKVIKRVSSLGCDCKEDIVHLCSLTIFLTVRRVSIFRRLLYWTPSRNILKLYMHVFDLTSTSVYHVTVVFVGPRAYVAVIVLLFNKVIAVVSPVRAVGKLVGQ